MPTLTLAKEQQDEPMLRRNRRVAQNVIHILPREHARRGLKSGKDGKSDKSGKGEKILKSKATREVDDLDFAEMPFLAAAAMSMSMSMSM